MGMTFEKPIPTMDGWFLFAFKAGSQELKFVFSVRGPSGKVKTIGDFSRGELNGEFKHLMSPAERLCLMALPKTTSVRVVENLLGHPFWQQAIDEILVTFTMEE